MSILIPKQTAPVHDDIARLACQIWERRGRPAGSDVECWLEAERKLLSAAESGREQITEFAQTPAALAAPAPSGKTSARAASASSMTPSRTNRPADTQAAGERKAGTARTTIPSGRPGKQSPGAAKRT